MLHSRGWNKCWASLGVMRTAQLMIDSSSVHAKVAQAENGLDSPQLAGIISVGPRRTPPIRSEESQDSLDFTPILVHSAMVSALHNAQDSWLPICCRYGRTRTVCARTRSLARCFWYFARAQLMILVASAQTPPMGRATLCITCRLSLRIDNC